MATKRAGTCLLLLAVAAFGLFNLEGCGDAALLQAITNLNGTNEVPVNTSAASGRVTITLNEDSSALTYTLEVTNINNVTQAHLHCCAQAGTNAGVVLFLFGPVAGGGGASNGVIASGTKTGADLIGSMAGQPLQALIDQIKLGNVYANVHTQLPGGAAGTPGNLPGGEIRGQVVFKAQ